MNDKASLELMDEHGVGYSVRGLVRQMRDNGNSWKQVSLFLRIPPCAAICAILSSWVVSDAKSDALAQRSPRQSRAPSVAGINCWTLWAMDCKPADATRLALLSGTLERALGRAPTTPPIRSRTRQAWSLHPQETRSKNAKNLAAPTSLTCPELPGACGNHPGLVVGSSNRNAFAQVEGHDLAVTAPSCGMPAILSCTAAACSAAGKPVAVAAAFFELVRSAWHCCWVRAPAAEGAEHVPGESPR